MKGDTNDNTDEVKSDDNSATNPTMYDYSLRKYTSRPISCNGDCGSQFAKLINNIIHPNVTSVTSVTLLQPL